MTGRSLVAIVATLGIAWAAAAEQVQASAESRPAAAALAEVREPVAPPLPPPAMQVPGARKIIDEIASLLGEIQTLAGQAQRQRDVVRHNCLAQYVKLIQAQHNRASAEQSLLITTLALLKHHGQPLTVVTDRGHFARILEARTRAQHLAWEARACTGEVTVIVPEDLAGVDQTRDPEPEPEQRPPLPARPPLASPANPPLEL